MSFRIDRKYLFVAFLGGLVVGLGMMQLLTGGAVAVVQEAQSNGLARMDERNTDLLARLREQDSELARLRAELANLRQPVVEEPAVAEAESAEPEPDRRPGFVRRMEERMSRRVDELATTYGLNDEQRQRLEEVFRSQMDNFRARRSGEEVPPFNLDAAVGEILTPEQFQQYLEDSQEEIYNRAELIATTQLVRLNQSVELLPEQQELVYDAVHYTAQEMMIARQTGEDFNMREVMQERLGSILTEDQMKAWQERPGPGGGMGFGP